MPNKLTTDEFIEKAKKIHNDKYDYSKVDYVNAHTKICIICKKHGEFWQLPCNHIKGIGCKLCYKDEKITNLNTFIQKSIEKHGNKYDYSKVDIDNKINGKVQIICPIHGSFWQTIDNHMKGKGCPYCYGNKKYTIDTFVEKANKIHGNKYDYSQTELTNLDEKGRIKIICPIHGQFFQTIDNHLNGQGCKYCAKNRSFKYTTDEFIEKAKKIHNNKYDYSLVEYKTNKTNVNIICPIHGVFKQTPSTHFKGCGCPKCNNSKLEKTIEKLLIDNDIEFEEQKTFNWLVNKKHLKLDFYLPNYNIAIECQGIQHFKICNFSKNNVEKFEKQFESTKKLDNIKKLLCEKNNIKILYFSNQKYEDNIITDKDELINVIKSYGK